jgi:DNA mismatch repair protein MutS
VTSPAGAPASARPGAGTGAFRSILFARCPDGGAPDAGATPECFADLHLDQIVAAVTAGREEYNLAPFFAVPLHDVDAVTFRHEVFQDLEDASLLDDIKAFAAGMRGVRDHLAQRETRCDDRQKERWLLDAVLRYGDAVARLARDLSAATLRARGLRGFRDYLARYVSSEPFVSLVAEARQLAAALAAIRYTVHIEGPRVEVRPYGGEVDYGAEIQATFARFQQGDARAYTFEFRDGVEMNPVEARILEGVAHLHAELFARLRAFAAAHPEFRDPTVVAFDREIQFYVAYLDHLAPLRKAGLDFCYPAVSDACKEVYARQGFDLALAGKLLGEHATPVCNDFELQGPERILVVSGPNQGGKTTFARMVGQLHYLASLGCPVGAARAQLYLPDRIFTHFERQEGVTTRRGKLEDDLVRMRDILEAATPRSLVIINEIFGSTTLRDAVSLSRRLGAALLERDVLGVWVTFLDEIAALSDKTVSMVATVVPEHPEQRTFKIVRRPADGLAYAMAIARKYRLTYEQVRARVGP